MAVDRRLLLRLGYLGSFFVIMLYFYGWDKLQHSKSGKVKYVCFCVCVLIQLIFLFRIRLNSMCCLHFVLHWHLCLLFGLSWISSTKFLSKPNWGFVSRVLLLPPPVIFPGEKYPKVQLIQQYYFWIITTYFVVSSYHSGEDASAAGTEKAAVKRHLLCW